VAPRTRAIDAARAAWHRRRVELGAELRGARHGRGLGQRAVGDALGVSVSEISRRELGNAPGLAVESLMAHGAAVGLRVVVNAYPAGGAVRDEAQLRYIATFLGRVSPDFNRQLEVPIPLAGDLRAVDIVLRGAGSVVAVEVITRLVDAQAQIRSAVLKARDVGATHTLIVVAGTHANRRALDVARPALASAWDFDGRRVMRRLARAEPPEANAIIVL
jgi:transcriptional regulator with XRE-family HTH domain